MLNDGLVNVNVTSLERRFGFNSSQSGAIGLFYDVGFCIGCLFISYYGMKWHRPRLGAIGACIMSAGAIIYSIPHFTTSNYEYSNTQEGDMIC